MFIFIEKTYTDDSYRIHPHIQLVILQSVKFGKRGHLPDSAKLRRFY